MHKHKRCPPKNQEWKKCLAKVSKENKGKCLKECMQLAKQVYRKEKGKGASQKTKAH